jgi:hypothetical protein
MNTFNNSADVKTSSGPLFLYIPISRLVTMSIISSGLYDAYWIYKNWRYIKERDNIDILPFWRGIFGVLFCHSLLRRIYNDKEARSVLIPSFSPGLLATGWVILTLFARIMTRFASSSTTIIIASLVPTFLFLAPVQEYINTVTKMTNPSQAYYGWTLGQLLCLVFGVINWTILLLSLAGELFM